MITTDNLVCKTKLWIETTENKCIIGDGKFILLKTIEQQGSLKKAVKILNISYRKAWNDINEINKNIGINLIEKHRGGNSRGSSSLTDDGKKLIKAYEKLQTKLKKNTDKIFLEFLKNLK